MATISKQIIPVYVDSRYAKVDIRRQSRYYVYLMTKLPESGDLCGNITEFGVAEGDPPSPQMKLYCHTDIQTKIVLFLYPTFYDFMSSPSKVYEIKRIYYFNLSRLYKLKCRNTPNCTTMLCYLCDVIITSAIIIASIVMS